MAEDVAPNEKAIEETAKATGKAVDLVHDGFRAVSPTISNAYGYLIGDRLAAARQRNLDAITRETDRILRERKVTDRSATPEQISIPLLEAAQAESRDELRNLWACLLANSIDPSRSENVRPEFINLSQKLEPLDARVLDHLHNKPKDSQSHVAKHDSYSVLGCRPTAAVVSIDHLVDLKCVRLLGGNHVLALTELGEELTVAVEA
jgi:Abortive infection alpha